MKKINTEIDDFQKLIMGNYLYIDKTLLSYDNRDDEQF